MPHFNKETVKEEARRLGIDITGLTWPQQQKAVAEAREREKLLAENVPTETTPNMEEIIRGLQMKVDELEGKLNQPTQEIVSKAPESFSETSSKYLIDNVLGEDPAAVMRQKNIMIAPGIAPTKFQYNKYDEELGEDLMVEEVEFTIGENGLLEELGATNASGTYKNIKSTGRKTVALSTLPKENAKIDFDFGKDWFPVVTGFSGEQGYLWTHHSLPNVKAALLESGYYEEFKHKFTNAPVRKYITGLICVDINTTNAVMRQIEKKAADNARG